MRILHTADTHLGFRQYGLQERRDDFFKAFQQVVNVAIEKEVGAVVHAGDLFDNRFPTTEDLAEILGELSRLKACGIPFLGVTGNHDGKRGKQWL
ncbi:MAG TPA: metallophosphoesterase, partial [Candidatus Bipolaricaulota bacterium]